MTIAETARLARMRNRMPDDKERHICPAPLCMTEIPASARLCQFHGRQQCACGGWIDAHARDVRIAVREHQREPLHIEWAELYEAVCQ